MELIDILLSVLKEKEKHPGFPETDLTSLKEIIDDCSKKIDQWFSENTEVRDYLSLIEPDRAITSFSPSSSVDYAEIKNNYMELSELILKNYPTKESNQSGNKKKG